jgi:DNA-binding CsgD family transcriptional regulator
MKLEVGQAIDAVTGTRAWARYRDALRLGRRHQRRRAAVVEGFIDFLHDPLAHTPLSDSPLRQLFGLTVNESRLAAMLVDGPDLKDAAEMLGITYETARSYIKQIFAKTATNRQSELIKLAGRLRL